MAKETVTKSQRFYCVSLIPDICKTPIGAATPPVPYSIVGDFADATGVSPNTHSHSEALILHQRSVIPTVKGDEPGVAGGIKSGTYGKRVETKGASASYFANGAATVQEGAEVWMNERNTLGKIYERGGQAPRSRLQQLAALAEQKTDDLLGQARAGLKSYALQYKDEVSTPLHGFAGDALDTGAKIGAGSGVIALGGLAVGATGIGAPIAAGMEVTAAAGGAVAGGVTATGSVTEAGASLLDQAADFMLDDRQPDWKAGAISLAESMAEKFVLGRIERLGGFLGKRVKDKVSPGKTPPKPPAAKPANSSKPPDDKNPGGKTRKNKDEKGDPPSDCCPKNQAPGKKPVASRHPVHFGTGEEVLYQTDFALDGAIPIVWTRCYRSSAESQDWGLLGARWSSAFTVSLSVSSQGILYHDDAGRALRLPVLETGQSYDNRKEGFVLARSAAAYELLWRDGAIDTFVAAPDGWLPHGFEGANAMRRPGALLHCQRYQLRRSVGRDGRGIAVEHFLQAGPDQLMLRVVSDDGPVIEAMRAPLSLPILTLATAPGRQGSPVAPEPARIGRIDEVRPDGTRICHVRYTYAPEMAESATPEGEAAADFAGDPAFVALPRRHNLVAQTNRANHQRDYRYRHHLLRAYTSYAGFSHGLEWVSQQALVHRWAGHGLDDDALARRFPLTLDNSYQARAIAATTADGKDEVRIDYLDDDTSLVTEAGGGQLVYTFDANWLATEVRRVTPGGLASLGRREWRHDGALLAEIDAGGAASRYTYDAAGDLITSTDALGNVSRIEYNAEHQPVAVTDALGHVTRQTYDAAGRLATTSDALGFTDAYRYDDKGRLVEHVDAKGGRKQFEYDLAGRLVQHTDCSGFATRYRYDENGRLVETGDALGQTTRFVYDVLGRMTGTVRPDGAEESFDFDATGNLLAHTDAAGHQTRYRYNGHDLPLERIDALGQRLEYRYDDALRLSALVNANGELYGFTYNSEGWLTSETGFDGKRSDYFYSAAGHLLATDSMGQRTDLMRDSLGQLQAKSTADGAVRYVYDALGRLLAVASTQAELSFRYDPLGQLLEERSAYFLESAPAPGVEPGVEPGIAPGAERIPDTRFLMRHAYDELGHRIQTTLPDGQRIDVLRYGSGHWHGTLWEGEPVVAIERDSLHRETLRRIGSGDANLVATRRYDAQSRVLEMSLQRAPKDQPVEKLRERFFAYDRVGNLSTIRHGWHRANGHSATLGTFSYTYDPIGQLLSAVQPGLTELFAFDPAGNMVDASASAPAVAAQGGPPSAPTAQPLPAVTGNLLRSYAGYRYQYDAQGNMVRKQSAEGTRVDAAIDLCLAYDAENRLIRADRSAYRSRHVAEYFYDAFSRRIGKRVLVDKWRKEQTRGEPLAIDSHSTTTMFAWNGDVMTQELQENKTVTYLYEADGFVPLALISCECKNNLYLRYIQSEVGNEKKEDSLEEINYYNCDHLGTARELISEAGNVDWSGISAAWGKERNKIRVEKYQPLRFQGQFCDEESGLHYNRNRYFDPNLASYTVKDPIGLYGGLNSYQYARNSTGWIDPLGLSKCMMIFYRGDSRDGLISMKSYAAEKYGYLESSNKISNGDKIELMRNHAESSFQHVSPYISVTTNPIVAEYFATNAGTRMGYVYKFKIPCEKVVKNHLNDKVIYINGKYLSEDEWLVNSYIGKSNVVGKRRVP